MTQSKKIQLFSAFLLIIFLAIIIFFTQNFFGYHKHVDSIHLIMVGILIGSTLFLMGNFARIERKESKYVWQIFLLISFHLIISLIFIIFFKFTFNYKNHLILTHLFMVWNFMVGGMLSMGALVSFDSFKKWRFSRYVLATVASAGSLFLLVLYIVDFSVNKMGARNITYDVFFLYLLSPKNIANLLPFSIYWVYIFFLILVVTVFTIYMKFSSLIFKGFCELILTVKQSNPFRNNNKYSAHLLFLILSCMASLLFMVKYLNSSHGIFWMGEPISNFVYYWSPITTGLNPHRTAVAKEDRRIRNAYPSGKPFLKKNVILIISDSLRADHMSVYGYKRLTTPFLDSMMTLGRLKKVKYTFAECPETAAGVLSILASRSYRSLSEYNFKLNELLRDNGYKVFYILSGDQTVYERLRWFFGQDIDLLFDGNNSKNYALADDRLIFEGLEKVPDYKGNPAFFYFHLMSSQFLGVRHDKFEKFKPSKLNTEIEGALQQEVHVNRYDNGVLQADSFIQEIFTTLDRKGYLSGSIVFILSDHGDGLGEHDHYGHDRYVYQEDIRIPMLIYDSKETHYNNLEFASQSDVAPTILDRLNLPIPDSWEGRSLLNSNIKEFIYSQTRMNPFRFSLLYRNDGAIYHYIRGPVKEELYELSSDPIEGSNLILTADTGLIRLMREETAKGFD